MAYIIDMPSTLLTRKFISLLFIPFINIMKHTNFKLDFISLLRISSEISISFLIYSHKKNAASSRTANPFSVGGTLLVVNKARKKNLLKFVDTVHSIYAKQSVIYKFALFMNV